MKKFILMVVVALMMISGMAYGYVPHYTPLPPYGSSIEEMNRHYQLHRELSDMKFRQHMAEQEMKWQIEQNKRGW